MLNSHYYCIILAGGIGSRFWPISRASQPKQFLDFSIQGRSFLRRTFDRMKAVIPEENIIVVSLERYSDLVRTQLPELSEENLLLEPYNRNTAPCIAYATYSILKRDPDAITIVTPSDHAIAHHDAFNRTLQDALAYAAGADVLITLGVIPTRPDPNFGYIQMMARYEDGRPVKIKTFTEKPDEDLARVFIETHEFLWNSGIFVWRADVIRRELEHHAPEIARLWEGWQDMLGTENEKDFLERIYTDMPRISIDYAVMEKTDNAWVYPASFRWADIGNWDSLYEYLAVHDDRGNALNHTNRGLLRDCTDNIVYSTRNDKLLAIRGLEDYIVIDTEDVLMICPRDEQKLKEFLLQLAMPEYEEYR
ncbi:MAG: NTP transferase domain-containing protein [Bacteroidales bacterium]|nr:NTP transferase domain-containing protein [Bacteroidales bacterium]